MLGRATGVCGGRAGSMNVIDLEHGLVGCFGIVGGSIAAATGAALSARRNGGVAVAFFGDGATNQGYFHECLNFAQVLRLPVVFACENNFYGEFTPMHQVTAGAGISARGAAYGVPARVVDGNDLLAVEQAAVEAVAVARSGAGPSLLECQTYRHYGHSKSDPATYRPKGELESWLERDPLIVTRARLVEAGVSDEQLDAAAERAKETMSRASEAALAAPYPDPEQERATEFAP
jgi:TPP-dependent pyruvate/acetoin dehydrogenase alpha subunit